MNVGTKGRARARWGVGAALALGVTVIGVAGPANADADPDPAPDPAPVTNHVVSGTVLGDPGRDSGTDALSSAFVYATDADGNVINLTGSPYCNNPNYPEYSNYYCSVSTDGDGHYSMSLLGDASYTLHFRDNYYFWGPDYSYPGMYLSTTADVSVADVDVTAPDVTMVKSIDCTTKTTLTGSLTVGQTLTAGAGTVTPAIADDVTSTYSWSRVGPDPTSNDASATVVTPLDVTGSTYTLTKADKGSQIQVQAHASSPTRSSDACDTLTSRVIGAQQMVPGTSSPTLTGSFHKGELVRAHTTESGAKVSYQWLSDGRFIPGAKYASYKLTRSDVGHRVSVRATFAQDGYAGVVRSSRDRAVTK